MNFLTDGQHTAAAVLLCRHPWRHARRRVTKQYGGAHLPCFLPTMGGDLSAVVATMSGTAAHRSIVVTTNKNAARGTLRLAGACRGVRPVGKARSGADRRGGGCGPSSTPGWVADDPWSAWWSGSPLDTPRVCAAPTTHMAVASAAAETRWRAQRRVSTRAAPPTTEADRAAATGSSQPLFHLVSLACMAHHHSPQAATTGRLVGRLQGAARPALPAARRPCQPSTEQRATTRYRRGRPPPRPRAPPAPRPASPRRPGQHGDPPPTAGKPPPTHPPHRRARHAGASDRGKRVGHAPATRRVDARSRRPPPSPLPPPARRPPLRRQRHRRHRGRRRVPKRARAGARPPRAGDGGVEAAAASRVAAQPCGCGEGGGGWGSSVTRRPHWRHCRTRWLRRACHSPAARRWRRPRRRWQRRRGARADDRTRRGGCTRPLPARRGVATRRRGGAAGASAPGGHPAAPRTTVGATAVAAVAATAAASGRASRHLRETRLFMARPRSFPGGARGGRRGGGHRPVPSRGARRDDASTKRIGGHRWLPGVTSQTAECSFFIWSVIVF